MAANPYSVPHQQPYGVPGQPQYALPVQPQYVLPVQQPHYQHPSQQYAAYPQGSYPQGSYPQGSYPIQGSYPQQPNPYQTNNPYPPQAPAGFSKAPPPIVLTRDVEIGVANDASMGNAAKYVHLAESAVRMGFIRKVYAILSLQLFLTFGMVAVFTFVPSVKNFVASNPGVLYGAMILSFGFLIALSCFPSVSRKHPTNLICLAFFTLCEGYLVGAISSYSGADAVIKAVACTLIITTGLTIYAWQTKVDFTAMGGYMFAATVSLILVGLMCAIFRSQILMNIYAGLGCLIFSAYIVYDTQLIIGGSHHTHSFEIDEYVFAALNLYIDIVQLFLFLLRLFRGND
jgi:protein lifeguard